MIWLVMAVRVGDRFTSFTMTVTLPVVDKGGVPLSVTRTAMLVVIGPWASVGVQVKMPLLDTATPAGAAAARP